MCIKNNIYFWRQSLVFSAVLVQCLSCGIILGYTAVINPALLSPNATDIRATEEQASWLSASLGSFSVIGYIVMPSIMGLYGRKTAHVVINVIQFVGWILFYRADSVLLLFAGRFLHGIGVAIIQVNGILVCEYSSPSLRGYCITLKTMFMAFGVLICHASLLYWSWRHVALLSAVCSALAILITIFWPESPAYLAEKGRFSDCEKSFQWLHGYSTEANKELNELISAQRAQLNMRHQSKRRSFISLWRTFFKTDFQKSLVISSLAIICIDTSGRYFLFSYAIQIINDIVDDTSMAVYYSIAGDGLTIFALLLAGPTIKYLKRRTLLLSFGSIAVILMLGVSVTTYIKANYTVFYAIWLCPCLILGQFFIINLSLVPVCLTIMGEVFTLDNRSLGSAVTGLIFCLFYTINIKLTSTLISNIGVAGMYGLNGVCLFLCLCVLYYIVPETKDRTLQDIENEIKGIKRDVNETQTILNEETILNK